MYFIVYASSATTLFSKDELLRLLATSRKNNERLGITGMLLYKDGNFMQVLEGEEQTVRTLHNKIKNDPRHRGMLTILQGESNQREYPEWSMGFRDLGSIDAQSIPGYNEFLNVPLTGEEFRSNPTRCRKLLLTFKQYM